MLDNGLKFICLGLRRINKNNEIFVNKKNCHKFSTKFNLKNDLYKSRLSKLHLQNYSKLFTKTFRIIIRDKNPITLPSFTENGQEIFPIWLHIRPC